jgi:hypothetical protein
MPMTYEWWDCAKKQAPVGSVWQRRSRRIGRSQWRSGQAFKIISYGRKYITVERVETKTRTSVDLDYLLGNCDRLEEEA